MGLATRAHGHARMEADGACPTGHDQRPARGIGDRTRTHGAINIQRHHTGTHGAFWRLTKRLQTPRKAPILQPHVSPPTKGSFPPMHSKYIRTCNECGHKQESKLPPSSEPQYSRWTEATCKKCKSPSLDYGSWKASEPYQD